LFELISPFMHIRIAAIAILILGFTLAVHAQTDAQANTQPKARQNSQPVATRGDDPHLYRNTTFGFHYRIPYGWVDRTQEMQSGNETPKAAVLLAVFEHPPEATTDTINSAVVIASESAASYPRLKKAEDYVGPLTELVTAKGFKVEGEPYAVDEDSRHLLRADFTKPISDKLTMHQCTLVLLAKNQIVSFTFISASDDELDELMDGLHFSPATSLVH
jgi:hypothetical protein